MAFAGKTDREFWTAFLGLKGTVDIDDTDTHTNSPEGFWRVEVITTCAFTTNTLVDGAAQSFGGSDIPPGATLIGNFTAIDLSKGHVVATKY